MEKTQKRIIPKKLLIVSLCLILLVVSVATQEGSLEPETPEGFYKDGIWFDPMIPDELMIPALNYSTEPASLASVTYPIYPAGERDTVGDGKITRHVLLAIDDDFLSHSYETPCKGILGAWEYARWQTLRAFVQFYHRFNIRWGICGEVTWHSDSSSEEGMFYEAIAETGFKTGKFYNGYVADALIAWTTEFNYWGGLGSEPLATAMISYQVYWADDNIAQHEFSHVFNATDGTWEKYLNGITDCYYRDCIMSNKYEYIEEWFEDGRTYQVYASFPRAYINKEYCDSCYYGLKKYLTDRYWFEWAREWNCLGGDC